MKIISISIAAAVFAASPVAATVPAPAAPSAGVSNASIDTIIAATLPDEMLRANILQGFDAGFDAQSAKDPKFQALAAKYPGLPAAVKLADGAEVSRIFSGKVPEMRALVRGLYATHFTPAELKTMADFYSSPTGRRMIAGATQAAHDTALARVKSGNTGAPDMAAINQSAGAGALRQVQGDDMPVLMAFAATPAAQKAKDFAPVLQSSMLGWMQQMIASSGPQIAAVTKQTIAAYIKAHPAKPG